MSDSLTFDILVYAANGKFEKLISNGTELPASHQCYFSTAVEGQTSIVIDIARGPEEAPIMLVRYTVNGIIQENDDRVKVLTQFQLDSSNQLKFLAWNEEQTEQLPCHMQRYSGTEVLTPASAFKVG